MRRVYVGFSALILAVTLVGCSDVEPLPAVTETPADVTSSPTEDASASAPASAKIAVNQTIRDDVMGHTIKVLSVVRNFPIPDRLPALKGSRELVLVELDLSAGSKYHGSLDGGDFRIVTEDGTDTNTQTTTVKADMQAAGYTPLPEDGARAGKTARGWVAFTVSPVGSETLTLRYKRLGANVVGSDQSIPEKTFDVPLVK